MENCFSHQILDSCLCCKCQSLWYFCRTLIGKLFSFLASLLAESSRVLVSNLCHTILSLHQYFLLCQADSFFCEQQHGFDFRWFHNLKKSYNALPFAFKVTDWNNFLMVSSLAGKLKMTVDFVTVSFHFNWLTLEQVTVFSGGSLDAGSAFGMTTGHLQSGWIRCLLSSGFAFFKMTFFQVNVGYWIYKMYWLGIE